MAWALSRARPGAAPEGGRRWDRRDLLAMALLAAVAAATRFPLAGAQPGEADSARYLLGLRQWSLTGPASAGLYGAVFSPLYYWLALHLAAALRLPWTAMPLLLNRLSAVAAVATVAPAYALGKRLFTPRIAFWSTLAFLLAPAVWWLGIEAHPQGLALVCWLGALACLARSTDRRSRPQSALAWLVALLLLTAAAGFKSDVVLLFGVFPALIPVLHPEPAQPAAAAAGPGRSDAGRRMGVCGRARRLLPGLLLPLGAGTGFLMLRGLLLHQSWQRLQHASAGAVGAFLEWPHGVEAVRQALPLATCLGPLLGLTAAAGALLWWARRPHPEPRMLLFLLLWMAPSLVFWSLIRGNNVRHLAALTLPLLWLALAGWSRLWPRAAPVLVLAALVADGAVIPASSNLTLYPSGNVPASAADLARRIRDMRRVITALPATPGRPVCVLGNATLPYLEYELWRAQPASVRQVAAGRQQLRLPGGRQILFVEVNSPAQYLAAARPCALVKSLEYGPRGRHRWFLGREWTWLPLHRRWYPGTVPVRRRPLPPPATANLPDRSAPQTARRAAGPAD